MPKEVIISAERIERVIGAMASGPVTYDDIKGRVGSFEDLDEYINLMLVSKVASLEDNKYVLSKAGKNYAAKYNLN
jgi:hypothetical protein